MKTRTNVSIERELIDAAREHGLSLSRVLDEALRTRLREMEGQRWRDANHDSIAAYAEYIAHNGVFSDGVRDF